jgi:hypothetical protein
LSTIQKLSLPEFLRYLPPLEYVLVLLVYTVTLVHFGLFRWRILPSILYLFSHVGEEEKFGCGAETWIWSWPVIRLSYETRFEWDLAFDRIDDGGQTWAAVDVETHVTAAHSCSRLRARRVGLAYVS